MSKGKGRTLLPLQQPQTPFHRAELQGHLHVSAGFPLQVSIEAESLLASTGVGPDCSSAAAAKQAQKPLAHSQSTRSQNSNKMLFCGDIFFNEIDGESA